MRDRGSHGAISMTAVKGVHKAGTLAERGERWVGIAAIETRKGKVVMDRAQELCYSVLLSLAGNTMECVATGDVLAGPPFFILLHRGARDV